MSQPIVFVSHLRIKEGKLQALKESFREGVEFIKAGKPATIAFLVYLNSDGTQVNVVHIFPDADSMDRHMEGADDRVKRANEFIETAGYEIYGTPSATTMEAMKRFAGSAIPLTVEPEYLAGYIRFSGA